jgi:UDP-N-acetyl-D-glucosamine dehydrogenase
MLALDVDPDKVNNLNEGRSYIKHVPADRIADYVRANRLQATTDFSPHQEP